MLKLLVPLQQAFGLTHLPKTKDRNHAVLPKGVTPRFPHRSRILVQLETAQGRRVLIR